MIGTVWTIVWPEGGPNEENWAVTNRYSEAWFKELKEKGCIIRQHTLLIAGEWSDRVDIAKDVEEI